MLRKSSSGVGAGRGVMAGVRGESRLRCGPLIGGSLTGTDRFAPGAGLFGSASRQPRQWVTYVLGPPWLYREERVLRTWYRAATFRLYPYRFTRKVPRFLARVRG